MDEVTTLTGSVREARKIQVEIKVEKVERVDPPSLTSSFGGHSLLIQKGRKVKKVEKSKSVLLSCPEIGLHKK